jgi:hypothetical protein
MFPLRVGVQYSIYSALFQLHRTTQIFSIATFSKRRLYSCAYRCILPSYFLSPMTVAGCTGINFQSLSKWPKLGQPLIIPSYRHNESIYLLEELAILCQLCTIMFAALKEVKPEMKNIAHPICLQLNYLSSDAREKFSKTAIVCGSGSTEIDIYIQNNSISQGVDGLPADALETPRRLVSVGVSGRDIRAPDDFTEVMQWIASCTSNYKLCQSKPKP